MACRCPKIHQFRVFHGHPRKQDRQKPVKWILGSMVLPELNVGGYSGNGFGEDEANRSEPT